MKRLRNCIYILYMYTIIYEIIVLFCSFCLQKQYSLIILIIVINKKKKKKKGFDGKKRN